MKIVRTTYFPYLVFLILFIIYAIIIIPVGFRSDDSCWVYWGKYAYEHGISNAYGSGSNYLPPYIYVMWIYSLIKGSAEAYAADFWKLKYFSLFIEFCAGILLYQIILKIVKNSKKALLRSLFYFCNIAMFFNTVKWGQVDGITASLSIAFFIFAAQEKVTLALVFLLLALNFKLQAAIILPLCILILIPLFIGNFSWKNLIKWITIPLFIQIAIFYPFYQAGTLNKVFDVLFSLVDAYPVVSMNGYNIWYFFLEGVLWEIPDSTIAFGMSYKNWGLTFFFISSALILIPFVMVQYRRWRDHVKGQLDMLALWFLIAGMISLVFYFFNTQMHERYSHPAVAFLACYAALSGRWKAMLFVSLGYLVNMTSIFFYDWGDAFAKETTHVAERVAIVCFTCGIIFGAKDLKNEYKKYLGINKLKAHDAVVVT